MEKATLTKFSSYYRLIAPFIQNLNPWALEPEQMAAIYHRVCTAEEFRETTGALVDSRCRILPPLESGCPLSPREVASEVWNTRHAPPYASDPANLERM